MKTILLSLLAAVAYAQIPVADVKLPTYIMGGMSYNQFTGGSAFVSGIMPESNSVGLYGSITADVVPVKFVDKTGKSGYLLSASVRAGQHKVIFNGGNNTVLVGGDLGASFTQPNEAPGLGTTTVPATAGITIGMAGSFTITYVRHFTSHVAVGVPIRMLWLSGAGPNGAGAWNPVAELGLIIKP